MEEEKLSLEGEARRSEATFSCSLTQYCDRISQRICYFITLNPYKKGKSFARLQKIGPVYDRLRKKGLTDIFIVRETNPDKSKHFHALCVGPAGLQAWDTQCLKVHVQRVGGVTGKSFIQPESAFTSAPEPTPEEKSEYFLERSLQAEMSIHHHLYDVTLNFLCKCMCKQKKAFRAYKAKVQKGRKKIRISGDLGRICTYMLKEIGTDPIIYEDYILPHKMTKQ